MGDIYIYIYIYIYSIYSIYNYKYKINEIDTSLIIAALPEGD